jgi:predicted MFS family arabinose efflux permease
LGGYFGTLVLLIYFSRVSIVPIQGYLKDVFGFTPEQQARSLLIMALPTFVAFLYGYVRDRWQPFGLPDRGILVVVCPLLVLVNVYLAVQPLSYGLLVVGIILSTAGFGLTLAAVQGQMADVAQHIGRPGLLATIAQTVIAAAAVLYNLVGGEIADHYSHRLLFLLVAGLAAAILGLGMWRPAGAYDARPSPGKAEWRGLVGARAYWLAALIWFLWAFGPAAQTPLLNFLTHDLHLTTGNYGEVTAIQQASFFPSLILYGFLCRRMTLRSLLVLGTLIGVVQWIPVMFVHSLSGAVLWAGIFVGLTGGIATGAYYDLILRSCPKRYTGVGVALAAAVAEVGTRGSDWLGGALMDHGGFTTCAVVTTAVYALILGLLGLVPRSLTEKPEGTVLA